jgi:hypothetical protein
MPTQGTHPPRADAESAPSPTALATGINPLKLPPECRRPFDGESGRKSDRFGEREIERLPAAIRSERNPEWVPVAIRDYSLLGFGLHAPASARTAMPVVGERAELRLQGPWGSPVVVPCRVRNVPGGADSHRIGLERLDLAGEAEDHGNALVLGENARIPVRIVNPVLYREWSDARLVAFGRDGLWIFSSHDASLMLFKDVPLALHFDLPVETDGECRGRIVGASREADGGIRFSVKWTHLPFQVANALGESLLQTESLAPADLLPFGIQLRKFRERLRFSVIGTLADYAKAVGLRQEAYVLAGKVPPTTTAEQFASRFDRDSRILAAYHGEEMVACLGLTFPRGAASPLKSEVLFPGGRYPVRVPDKAKLIEAHTFCTRKAYRGGDLVRGVFEQVARCLLLSDRDWIITLATGELWPLYRKIGFRKAGASVRVEYFGGLEHHLILLHRSAWETGAGMTVFAWNYFYGDLIQDLVARKFLELDRWQSAKVACKSWFGGAARRWSEAKLEKEYRFFLENVQARRRQDG